MTLVDPHGAQLLRIAIVLPCQDQVDAGFALDLSRLIQHTTAMRPDIVLTVIQNRGTIIPQQRHTLVLAAQEFRATHLLWLDSDMRFPKDTLFRLLSHDEPIVAANYSRRRHPVLPTAEHSELGYLFTTPDATGLEMVTQCGMGVMLTQMAVFTTVPQPWFQLGWSDGAYVGEDFFFCRRAKASGFPTLIDQDVSQEVRHVGSLEYRAEHACVTRDAYTKEA